jgi:hypothetical protein
MTKPGDMVKVIAIEEYDEGYFTVGNLYDVEEVDENGDVHLAYNDKHKKNGFLPHGVLYSWQYVSAEEATTSGWEGA